MNKTIIGSNAKINGNIIIETDISIFGEIDGLIETKKSVTLENGCNVRGNIKAQEINVKGLFKGDVNCTSINILKGGKFIGNIESEILVVSLEGLFEGNNKIKDIKTISSHKKCRELDTENILL